MSKSPDTLRPEILAYYKKAPEATRLQTGPFKLEFARTKEVIRHTIPAPPARILDVGGGTGPYALWLASLGYEVHLIDPVADLVNEARLRSEKATLPLASCRIGDARALEAEDCFADVILELGPLYHLTNRDHRLACLREALRILSPGGIVIVAAISRFASALDGLFRNLLSDPDFTRIVERDLHSGVHRNDTGRLDYFTTAYFHRPVELEEEVLEAGFQDVRVIGLEGPAWLLSDFERRWHDSERREEILWIARVLEQEPAIRALSAHLLAVGQKPEN
ncbi:MAG: methyltransferase domain-containing protein [Phycisphaerae bacterium]|nr:class I SAM-dependent methyltransferase [candidate division KSB1 bacterium]NIV01325.1 methyltransferase domain-containing protein [Phycisphaerae bacterium]NIV69854.1 methyltransferase domain-containing protein [Phycisphaerae bacterium]